MPSTRDLAQHYHSEAVSTAPPAQLVLMLYDRALLALRRSRAALDHEPRDLTLAHHELTRGQDILAELIACLDVEKGGTLAEGLARLYEYFHSQLVQANLAKRSDGLERVEDHLRSLRDAWEESCVDGAARASA